MENFNNVASDKTDTVYDVNEKEIGTFENNEDDIIDSPSDYMQPVKSEHLRIEARDLLARYNEGELIVQPDFQRQYVWENSRACRLIESILYNVPIPAIFLAAKANGDKEVIDGQQRLTTIFRFLKNEFKLTAISKNNTNYYKKSFAELSKDDQKRILNYKLNIIEIDVSANLDIIYDMFERINSGSVSLNAQELRNSVYRGEYNSFIKELSANRDFRYIIDGSESSLEKRMIYEELVLLFFTIMHAPGGINHLKGVDKQLLNKEMINHASFKLNSDQAKEYRKFFQNTVATIKKIFDQNAFKVFDETTKGQYGYKTSKSSSSMNRGLYIAIMYIFSQSKYSDNALMAKKDLIVESFKSLMINDQAFKSTVTESTMDRKQTQLRIKILENLLDKAMDNSQNQPRSFTYAFKESLYNKNPTCALCGNKIDNIESAEVDHILAFVKGGSTTADNAQLTHRSCNRSKSSN